MTSKPSIFIGSSNEQVQVAYAIQANLGTKVECTVWDQNIFDLSSYPILDLVDKLGEFNYAIFVIAPDDITHMRKRKYNTVRDNVIFEVGLSIGKIGLKNTFLVGPEGIEKHLPSDFSGLTYGIYDPKRRDNNLRAALGTFCTQVINNIKI